MVADPGMPSVRVGMKDVCAAALLAASGEAIPSTAPFPKREGSRATLFSNAYAAKEAMVGPAPGNGPKKLPTPVPRRIGLQICLISSLVGISDRTVTFSGLATYFIWLTDDITSATPNRPIASIAIGNPS